MRHGLVAALAGEAIGTFALVFAGTGAVVVNAATDGAVSHVGVCLTFGLVVMAMIYAVGDVSGAHFNPAVSLAFAAAGRLSFGRAGLYVVVQLLAAIVASVAVRYTLGTGAYLGATLPRYDAVGPAFLLEVILSVGLMFVILSVAAGAKETGIMAGIAIGATVGLAALFAGPISGASMNPARSLGPALVSGHLPHLWLYLTAPLLGTLLAVPLWTLTRPPIK